MPLTEITAALGSLKAATDIAKAVQLSVSAVEKAEIRLKLADLMLELANAKGQIADVQSLVQEKDAEIIRLEAALALDRELEYEPPYYWRRVGDVREGPFCQACVDTKRTAVRLQLRGNGVWECKGCTSTYFDSSHKRPSPIALSSRPSSPLDRY